MRERERCLRFQARGSRFGHQRRCRNNADLTGAGLPPCFAFFLRLNKEIIGLGTLGISEISRLRALRVKAWLQEEEEEGLAVKAKDRRLH